MEETCPACGQKQLIQVAVCQQCHYPFYGSDREKSRHIQKHSNELPVHTETGLKDWRKLLKSIKLKMG